jgi:electron transfer flavoprotein-quinone oxidoreductase
MSAEEKFDAIVIGAGPAGLACAYALAREGKEVVLLERGSSAGEKNYTGGRMYAHALEALEPGLCEEPDKALAQQKRVLSENETDSAGRPQILVSIAHPLRIVGCGS